MIRPGAFDVRGCKSLLDAACGNGRYSVQLLKHAEADARLTAFDLSKNMLARARQRLHSDRLTFSVADMTRLPYPAAAFDAAVAVMAAQRHARVIGVFARLWKRDGKPGYLPHIPRVWRLLERALGHPGLAPLRRWFDTYVPAAMRRAPEAA